MASLISFQFNLKTIDHLNLKLLILVGILHVLRFDFQKFRILEILNFHHGEHFDQTEQNLIL